MAKISNRFEQILKSAIEKNPILPVKVAGGILVGDVLIESNGNLKNIWKDHKLVYSDVSLNKSAITIANLLAKRKDLFLVEKIFKADQEYGKWYQDSQLLRHQHSKLIANKDFDKSDIIWARYTESKIKATQAKEEVDRLTNIE